MAYTNEGIVLREAGITSPIMVMNADFTAIDLLIEHNLEPVLLNPESLENGYKRVKQMTNCPKCTLRTRHEAPWISCQRGHYYCQQNQRAQSHGSLYFSHLVSSNTQHDHFTQGQIGSFSPVHNDLKKLLDSLC